MGWVGGCLPVLYRSHGVESKEFSGQPRSVRYIGGTITTKMNLITSQCIVIMDHLEVCLTIVQIQIYGTLVNKVYICEALLCVDCLYREIIWPIFDN